MWTKWNACDSDKTKRNLVAGASLDSDESCNQKQKDLKLGRSILVSKVETQCSKNGTICRPSHEGAWHRLRYCKAEQDDGWRENANHRTSRVRKHKNKTSSSVSTSNNSDNRSFRTVMQDARLCIFLHLSKGRERIGGEGIFIVQII